jgi:AAA+ superfamily predicted ATPase
MATADQIKAMVKSFALRDESRFYSVALQVAVKEEKKGHGKFAEELRELVRQQKEKPQGVGGRKDFSSVKTFKARQENKGINGLLHLSPTDTRLAEMVLDSGTFDAISRVILEHRQKHALEKFALTPRRKLLLTGPPGTGKTLTAKVLATELGLPLYTLQFDGLISRYLGETASKLRAVFDFIRASKAVYLFDEFDAIGSHRSNENDVGEIRRVLNSFLQFFEEESSESLIVCATNYPESLDAALFRRFDDVIKYHCPDESELKRFVENKLFMMRPENIKWDEFFKKAAGLSYAMLARVCDDAARTAVLYRDGKLITEDLLKALDRRQ